ncbi:MAG: InlB B-repeat-containing protein [Paludibacteraceae bacterium]|nr:InlB B-repeat-containing protein [Paludibacteraceae bacterium]
MKKLFTFLLVLMASSCLWASITYELNGGKYNDYDWNNKGDMYYSVLVDINAITLTTKINFETVSLEEDKTKAVSKGIPTYWSELSALLNNAGFKSKWGWLIDYMDAACSAQSKSLASSSSTYLRYNLGAFFIESNASTYLHAVYDVLGKDAAYIPAWGQNYPNPEHPTEEVTLVNPHRVGYIFGGWYDNPECTGTPITTVNASTTGTLYAKWVLDGIVYELNGGKYNDYGWTSKADICLDLQKDYNSTYSTAWSWVKKENGVILYCVDKNANTSNRDWQWMTENDAKGTSLIATKLYADTYRASDAPARLMPLVETTMKEKYGWLKDFITANRTAQSMTGDLSTLGETFYRAEIAAFFYCSPAYTSYPKSSSYETTGDYEDFQPYWGQVFPNPEHPTAEVVLNNPVKEGYEFGGWYKEADFSGTPITIVDQNFKGTLYAKWTQSGIVYELNGGVWNNYGWTNKSEMFAACMAEAGVTGLASLDELKAAGAASFTTICTPLDATKCQVILDSDKWEWLEQYIMSVQNPQKGTIVGGGAIAELIANTADPGWRFAIAAFFLEMQNTAWPRTADFSEAGKDAAYIPAWGQSYGNPEHPTEEVTLVAPYKPRYNFEGWYDNAECTGTAITTVDENYAGTLYAKWSLAPVLYNLNGGQYNEYGWKSKKDVYDDFIADWNTYSGTTRKTAQYEDQLGVGKSNGGIPTTITTVSSVNHRENLAAMFTNPTYSAKWGWLATYIDAVAVPQGKTQPTSNADALTFSLGNFFGEDNNHSTDYIGAVDFTGDERYLVSAQTYCSFTLPNPTYPTSEVTINNPTKEGYIFDGWYASADFSGAKVTKVNADTKGTLYAKWKEDAYSRTVTNGNYGTICLPKGSKQTSGAIFYELACKDAQYVYLEQVTILEAGVPYIFKATSNTLKVVYNTTEVATAGNHNGLYGTFVDIQDAATSAPSNVLEGNYLLVSNTIKKCGTNCKVLANRAYIKLGEIPNSASAAPGRNRVSMKYEGENEATGLDNITEDSNIAPALQGTYDIMGRKLTEPSTTGFYIVNGKKVIIMK